MVINGKEDFASVAVLAVASAVLGLVEDVVTKNRVDLDLAKEVTLGLEHTPKQQCGRCAHGGINTILNGGEDSDKNTSKENDHLQRRDSPELVNCVWRGDEITDSVDDNGRETGTWNVEEHRCQRIDSQEDHNGSDDTGKRRAHTSLGLDGSTREGSGSWVCAEEGTKQVGDTNSDQLLRRIDCVVIDTPERLGNRNMLNE